MNQVFIGLGSNRNHPLFRIHCALKQLNRIRKTKLVRKSSLYETIPLGPKFQPNYINAVAELKTYQSEDLLKELQHLENFTTEKKKNGVRSLDLDILIYDDIIMNTEDLIIPTLGRV